MIYRKVRQTEKKSKAGVGEVSYEVYEGKDLAAEFGYHVEHRPQDAASRFWIDGIRLSGSCSAASVMEAVLQFIQYKCQEAGCSAMHVRLNRKNLFYLELYQKFGFYMIDQEEQEPAPGQVSCISVFKYPIPNTREEFLRSYILRSERKRAKTQPQ